MIIAMLAIIGATIGAGVGYWICFGVYCLAVAVRLIVDAAKKLNE
jgi:hypothetical protein